MSSKYTKSTKVLLTLSFIFLLLSILGFWPVYNVSKKPQDGMEGMGPGIISALSLLFVALPASILSLIFGLVIVKESKLSFITIVPTSALLLYVLYGILTK